MMTRTERFFKIDLVFSSLGAAIGVTASGGSLLTLHSLLTLAVSIVAALLLIAAIEVYVDWVMR